MSTTGGSATNSNTVCVGNGNVVSTGDVTIVGDNQIISGRDTLGCAGQNRVVGDGKLVTETREVGPFAEVHVSHRFHVELQVGGPSLVLELDSNLLGLVETVVQGGELHVQSKQPNTEIIPSENARILITVPSLTEVNSSGASSATGTVSGAALTLIASGASSIDITVDSNTSLDVEASGRGAISVAGSGDVLRADLSGASSLKSALAHRKVDVTTSGTASATVHAGQSATVSAAGTSSVEIAGAPTLRDVDAARTARVSFHN